MYKTITRYTFICSFILGALLGIVFYEKKNQPIPRSNHHPSTTDKYEKWFNELNLKRIPLSMDYIRYGKQKNINFESKFLYDRIKITCVILTRKRKNAAAANQTWAHQCNDKLFIYLQPEKVQKTKLPIRQTKLESSWHLLCDAIRTMNDSFHWALFLNDDTFGIPENVRRMVAPLDSKKGFYLGHAIAFWGTEYNAAQAGYVLSKGSIELLQSRFNSTEACAAGGRFWRQEDYYLGKHLGTLGVFPVDTRDQMGHTTFHGHSLAQLLTPGSLSALSISNYFMRSVYPTDKCCSKYAVTFQTIEADKMYTNNYMLYQLEVFRGGRFGNVRSYHKPEDDEIVSCFLFCFPFLLNYNFQIWRKFVSEQRGNKELFEGDISPEAYFELWKTVVNDPINFNRNIRKWSVPTTSNADSQIHTE